jgi:hypothetical protein
MKKAFLSIGFIVFSLFLFAGVPKASAFFVSALPKVAGYKIVKDYGINLISLGWSGFRSNGDNYVKDIQVFSGNKILNNISQNHPKGANACIEFRVSYQTISCEYVKIVPKNK